MEKMIPSITKLEKGCQSVDCTKKISKVTKKDEWSSELNPAMKVEIKLKIGETPFMPGNGDLPPRATRDLS